MPFRLIFCPLLFILILSNYKVIAQVGINYQAYIYEKVEVIQPGNNPIISHVPVRNQPVCIHFNLGVFSETHTLTTDEQGMISTVIGSVDTISFNSLNWYNLYVNRTPLYIRWSRGTNCSTVSFDTLETVSFSGVPYAFFSHISDSTIKSVRSDSAVFANNGIDTIFSSCDSILVRDFSGRIFKVKTQAKTCNLFPAGKPRFCDGDSLQLFVSSSDTSRIFRYLWKKDGSVISSTSLPFLFVNDAGVYSVILDDTASVCRDIYSNEIRIFKDSILPPAYIYGPSCVYRNDSIQLSFNIPGGFWGISDTSILKFSSGFFKGINPGIAMVTYKLRDASCCIREYGQKTIVVAESSNNYPLIGDSIVCVGSTTTISSSVVGGHWHSSNNAIFVVV